MTGRETTTRRELSGEGHADQVARHSDMDEVVRK